MIIKMSQRSNGRQLSIHLKSDENEKIKIVSIRGTLSQHISGAINEFECLAKGSYATKSLAHCIISPHPNEIMDDNKWKHAWKLFEKVHGLTDYANIKIEHLKNNRTHQHAVYSRIDYETGKAINLSHTHRKNEFVSRVLEIEFGHSITKGKHNKAVVNQLQKLGMNKQVRKLSHLIKGPTPNALYTHIEYQMRNRDIPINKTRLSLAEAWLSTKTKEQFHYEITKRGFFLTVGNKTPIANTEDGREIPLLRAINAGLKSKNISRIKKSDLLARIQNHIMPVNEKNKKTKTHNTKSLDSIKQNSHSERNQLTKSYCRHRHSAGTSLS